MSKTAMYVIGGAVVVGGLWWLRNQSSPYPLSAQGAARNMAPRSATTADLGVAFASFGGKVVSSIDKIFAARASNGAPAYVAPNWGSSSDNPLGTGNDIFGMSTPDNPFGTG